jgi:asparagine synthase (glutamine-hydrolysing)
VTQEIEKIIVNDVTSARISFVDIIMCGIWCIFGSSVDADHQMPSCFNIAHRGPDCFRFENVNHFSRCMFGFHRLAIVDDIYGMQPMRIHALPHIWMVR